MTMVILTVLFLLLGPFVVLGIWLWMRSRREPVALIERFDIGRVLGRAFSVFSREGLPIAGLAILLVGIPNAIWVTQFRTAMAAAIAEQPRPLTPVTQAVQMAQGRALLSVFSGPMLGLMVLLLIVGTVFYIAAIRLRVRSELGEEEGLVDALKATPRLLLPTLAVALLGYFAVVALFMLFIVPGVVMALSWLVAIPVMIDERTGIIEAFRRSRALAIGSRGRLLVVALLILVLGLTLSVVSNLLMRGMIGAPGSPLPAIGQAVVTTVSAMLHAGFFASAYVELKRIREGTTIPTLAEVFA